MTKSFIKAALLGAFVLFLGWFIWTWGFCRVYVPPGYMGVVTAKVGDPLPPGEILAKKGQLGVQEDVLGEGRHFLDPFSYDVEITPVVNVPPGNIGIVTSKVGADLPPGEFLAAKGQKGIWREVLGPGAYRMNPQGYNVEVIPAVSIPVGFVGVVTSLSGTQAPAGAFAGPNQKGVREDVLQPGLYYINPKELKVDVLEIGVNQVSLLGAEGSKVLTKTHLASQNQAVAQLENRILADQQKSRESYQAEKTEKGKDSLLFAPLLGRSVSSYSGERETGESPRPRPAAKDRKKELPAPAAKRPDTQGGEVPPQHLGRFVEFPSRDGFEITLDMTVEFELLPKNIAWVFRSYGDLPAVVDKILMPQIQSISRLKGSAYRAKDFIVGEGRAQFQNDLKNALASTLDEKNLLVHNALIRHVGVPNEILDPIQKASIAVEEDLTNKEKQNTAKKQAELNTEMSLISQKGQQVGQETQKLKAEIKANQEREVARLAADTIRKSAEVEQRIAQVRADTSLKLGAAKAETVRLVEGEKAKGTALMSEAFGDPLAYNLYEFTQSLNPDIKVNILHSGQGTLWTDIKGASVGEVGGATILTK